MNHDKKVHRSIVNSGRATRGVELLPILALFSAILSIKPVMLIVALAGGVASLLVPHLRGWHAAIALGVVPWGESAVYAVVLGVWGGEVLAEWRGRDTVKEEATKEIFQEERRFGRSSNVARLAPLIPFLPLIALPLGWGIGVAGYAFVGLGFTLERLLSFKTVLGELADTITAVSAIAEVHQAFTEGARWSCIGVSAMVVAHQYRNVPRRVTVGNLLAALVIIGGVILQYTGAIADTRSSFWRALGRWSGTVSDPNALGGVSFVALLLCSPALISPRQRGGAASSRSANSSVSGSFFHALTALVPIGCAIGLIGSGLLSGSRSFVMAVVGWVALLVMGSVVRRFGARGAMIGSAVGLLFLVVSWYTIRSVPAQWLPSALARASDLCIFGGGNEGCAARWWLPEIAIWQWRLHPVIGNGPGSFERLMSAGVHELGLPLGLWVDNAANSYAQLLAEYGGLGVLGALWLVLGARVAREGMWRSHGLVEKWEAGLTSPLSAGLIIGAFVLAVGAFLEVAETCVLVGAVVGLWLAHNGGQEESKMRGHVGEPPATSRGQPKSQRPRGRAPRDGYPSEESGGWSVALTGVLGGAGIVAGYLTTSFGLFPLEDVGGRTERWTGAQARFGVVCETATSGEPTSKVTDTEPYPLIIRNGSPQHVEVAVVLATATTRTPLSPGQRATIPVPCRRAATSALIRLNVTPPWQPRATGHGDDPRVLGVRLEVEPWRLR